MSVAIVCMGIGYLADGFCGAFAGGIIGGFVGGIVGLIVVHVQK